MTYQLQETDRLGTHCHDNPHIMEMVLELFDFYDFIKSEVKNGKVSYVYFARDARELLEGKDSKDIDYAIFQVGSNRDFTI